MVDRWAGCALFAATLLGGCLIKEQAGSGADAATDEGGTSTGDAQAAADATSTTTGPPPLDPQGASGSSTSAVPEGATDTGATTGRRDADTDGVTTSAGATFVGDCCMAQRDPGCEDEAVTTCVCDLDPYCCETAWDAVCVDLMVDAGCHTCGSDTMPTNGGPPGDCCAPELGEGCLDDMVRTCVCGVDPFCCDVQWDQTCVDAVEGEGCGMCSAAAGPCCDASRDPGCAEDPTIEACVCAQDAFCCSTSWDNLCVDEVVQFGCGKCVPVGPGDCCAVALGPGCLDPAIEACVCAADGFCCSNTWDQVCVDEVSSLGCGMCPGGSATGGDTGGMDTGVGLASSGGDYDTGTSSTG